MTNRRDRRGAGPVPRPRSRGAMRSPAASSRRPRRGSGRRPRSRGGLLGGDLRRLRNLAYDLDDVAVRIEDALLAVGAVAAPEDLLDPRELGLGAELPRVGGHDLQGAPDHLRDRLAVASAGDEVHDGRLETVPRGEPLVLGREDAVVARDLLARIEALRVVLDERLAERDERDDVVELRHGIADPDLDRPEARMEADVPPDVRVVRDAAGALELPDDLCVVGVVPEAGRGARARERRVDHVP